MASIQYNIDEPIKIIYISVDDLRNKAEMTEKLYTPEQLVDLGYMVVASQLVFRSDLRRWIRRPSANQSWPDFIIFFCEAHHELREAETSMDKMGYQLANTIISQIVDQLHAVEDDNPPEPPDESQMAPIEQPIPQAKAT